MTPTRTFITGHFVAYFCEGDQWYEADDSTVQTVETCGAPPHAFPYICILERRDLEASMPWPAVNFVPCESNGLSSGEDGSEPLHPKTPEAKSERPSTCSPIGLTHPPLKRRRLTSKQKPNEVWRISRSERFGNTPAKKPKRVRAGRVQQRVKRVNKPKKEAERKWKSRRAEKEQAVRKQNLDRSSRLQEDLRQMHSKRVAIDNNDGTRQDAQANLYNPVLESLLEEKKRADACEQRVRHGDIFLLLHLLDPLLIVDTAIRKLETFYLYAGFDCTHRWSNFLGDVSRSYLLQMSICARDSHYMRIRWGYAPLLCFLLIFAKRHCFLESARQTMHFYITMIQKSFQCFVHVRLANIRVCSGLMHGLKS